MKSILFVVCVLIFSATQSANVFARELKDYRDLADQYYSEGNYKKAFKGYLKIAKIGDHYSQYWVSHMYANGEGKKVDLEAAYGWSALAAESGKEKLIINSEAMLERVSDKNAALKAAEKLNKKYGKEALQEKAVMVASRDIGRRSGSCVGSRLTCQRGSAYGAPITSGSVTLPQTTGSN